MFLIPEFKYVLLFLLLLSENFWISEAQLGQLFSNLPTVGGLQPTRNTFSSEGLQFKQREILNETTNSILEWKVDSERLPNSTITFAFSTNLQSNDENTAVILLGLSRKSYLEEADVVAVRIGEKSEISNAARLVDMHGVDNNTVVLDRVQNWNLVMFQRNASWIQFTVSRILDTCDDQDIAINIYDTLHVLWGHGLDTTGRDTLQFTPVGSIPVFMTDPVVSISQQGTTVRSWRLARTVQLKPRRTSYWCTIHRGPELAKKHHIIGYQPYFKDKVSEQRVHHLVMYRCNAAPGINPSLIFNEFIGHQGEECYLEEQHKLPTAFCNEVVYTWSLGGKPFNLPTDVGLALGGISNEYYMIETHYDNVDGQPLVVENGVDFLYTEQIRTNEGSVIFVGAGIFGLYQVPPHVKEFTMVGYCSPPCTKQMIPPSGMEIVAVAFHSHMTTHKMTLKHFRGNKELPWILHNGYFDFTFQQKRLLAKPVTVLPGDQLITECVMDTTARNGTSLSSFASTDEMCMAFLTLNKRLPYTYCTSDFPTERTMEMYGVQNMTWSREDQERVVNASENQQFVGLSLSRVVGQSIGSWTTEMIRDLEREQIYQKHEGTCPPNKYLGMFGSALVFADDLTGGTFPGQEIVDAYRPTTRSIRTSYLPTDLPVTYPSSVTPYAPPQTCTA